MAEELMQTGYVSLPQVRTALEERGLNLGDYSQQDVDGAVGSALWNLANNNYWYSERREGVLVYLEVPDDTDQQPLQDSTGLYTEEPESPSKEPLRLKGLSKKKAQLQNQQ